MESLDKLTVEENYLQQQIFNVDETSIIWKWMPVRTFICEEAKSMPGFKGCVRTLHNVPTMTKLTNDAFLRIYPHR